MDQPPIFVAICCAACLVALTAAAGAWRRRRDVPSAVPLCVVAGGLSWWSLAAGAGAVVPAGPLRQLTGYLVVPGVAVAVAGFWCEARAVAVGAWSPSRRGLVLLAVEPVVVTVVALTNPWHHLFATFPARSAGTWATWAPGPLFWAHAAYSYGLLLWAFAVLAAGLRRPASPLQTRQVRGVAVAGLLPVSGNLLSLAGIGALPDLTPLFVLFAGAVHFFAVFREGMLLRPVPRDLVVDSVSDAVFVIDTRGLVVDVNPAARRLVRLLEPDLRTDLVGLPVRRLLPPVRQRKALTNGEYQVAHPDGELDLDLRISDLTDGRGHPLGRVVVARDVTELNEQRRRLYDVNSHLLHQLTVIDELRQQLAEQAFRDELTGLHNRRHLTRQLEVELERARANATPLAVVLLDIDHFKAVNDRFGHAVGDDLLTATAHALASAVRREDTVARYGGEEFVVLLPGAGPEEALACAETMRRRCSTVLVDSRQGPVSATISVGVASFPDCGWTGAALLQSADDALYVAKGAGRDRVVAAFPDWTG